MEFIRKALLVTKHNGKVAMLLRTLFVEGKNRYDKLFSVNPQEVSIYLLEG